MHRRSSDIPPTPFTHHKGAIIPHTLYEEIRLRTLHKEIDLFDRKLAHMALYGVFASEADRRVATKKMTNKRATLELEARQLADKGIPFKTSELPRSFRSEESPAEAEATKEQQPEEVEDDSPAAVLDSTPMQSQESPFAGTSLDGKKLLMAYKRKKEKKDLSDPNTAEANS